MFRNWLERSRAAFGLVAAVLLAGLLFGTGSALAQEGAIGGQVVDSETLEPVPGAQVFVPGTVIGALTNDQGRYRFEGVPVGQVTVRVQLIGYKQGEQAVTVEAGQIATADFELEQTALRLQDIVVTGVIGETPRVKLPFVVERLDAGDMPVRTSDVSSLLQGKTSGMAVVKPTGQPGQAADILLRGPTSIDASGRGQGPLIVVDGVVQSRNATLADINALDIDHVEIVKGAAAASIFGARAQNGVIQITTKRGSDLEMNTFDVLFRGEYGINSMERFISVAQGHPYAMNEAGTQFIDTNGNEVDYTNLGRAGVGGSPILECHPAFRDTGVERFPGVFECPSTTTFQDEFFPGTPINQVRRFFDPGETILGYAAITGRFGESSFRVSFEEFIEEGVIGCAECRDIIEGANVERIGAGLEPFEVEPRLPNDEGFERQNARLNVDSRIGDLDVAASGFYSRSFQDDQAVDTGGFFSLLFMGANLDLTELGADGYPRPDVDPLSLQVNPLYLLSISEHWDNRTRAMGSVDLAYTLTDWLSLEAAGNYDRTEFNSNHFHPKNEVDSEGGNNTPTFGSMEELFFNDQSVGLSATASLARAFMEGDLTTRFKVRYVLEDQNFEQVESEGSRFQVEGVRSFGALSTETFTIGNVIQDIKGQGYFAIGSFDYKGKYILDGLARRDGSSLFGPDERWHWYFRGSAAWRIAQEDFWNVGWWDEFKLRFSYGTAGGRPCFTCQFETFSVSQGIVSPVNLGNAELKPEFTIEREAGANLVLFDNLGLDVTYAWATTDDQLLRVPQPAFVGFQSRWENAGKIRARTWEASLRWAAVDTRETGLNFRVNFDRTRQRILELDVPAFKSAGGQQPFWIAEGRPLGETWGHKWASSCTDLQPAGVSASDCQSNFQVNDDGLLVFVGEGNAFTDGISNKLWGTSGTLSTPGGIVGDEQTYGWGLPVKVWDRDPVCVDQGERPVEECAVTDFLPLGNTTPDFSLSFATNARYKGFTVNALLDAVVGFELDNNTLQWPIRDHHAEFNDQMGKPEGLMKSVQYTRIIYNVNAVNSFFQEDGTFLKVRELALGYSLPESLLSNVIGGALDRVTINVIGRNLFTFTDYKGYDPEVAAPNQFDQFGSAALGRSDAFNYPNFRNVTAAVEVVF